MTTAPERSVPKPVFTDAEAGAKEFPDSNARRFNYYTPAKRKQTHYEDVTVEDRAEGLGLGPPRAGALPGLGRQGLRLASAWVARVPRPQ